MDSKEDLRFSENIYYESSESPNVFTVTVLENQIAINCGLSGKYSFHVNSVNMSLVDLKTEEAIFVWPYRYIRRYGRSPTNFQFEAGRKCRSGEGLFSLATLYGEGEQIYECVQSRLKQIKLREKGVTSPTTPIAPPIEPFNANGTISMERKNSQSSVGGKPLISPKPQLKPANQKSPSGAEMADNLYDPVCQEYYNKVTMDSSMSKSITPDQPKLGTLSAAAINELIANKKQSSTSSKGPDSDETEIYDQSSTLIRPKPLTNYYDVHYREGLSTRDQQEDNVYSEVGL